MTTDSCSPWEQEHSHSWGCHYWYLKNNLRFSEGLPGSDMKLNWAWWNWRLLCLILTPWPSELKITGKMIWDWGSQSGLPLTLPSFSHPAFAREVKSRCPRWIIDNFSIFPSSFFPFSFLIRSQMSVFALRAVEVSARHVGKKEGHERSCPAQTRDDRNLLPYWKLLRSGNAV